MDIISYGAAKRAQHTVDWQRSIYNAKYSNLKKTRAMFGRLLNGGSGRILCVGDSTTAGQTADPSTVSYPTHLRKALRAAGFPIDGTGFVCAHNNDTGNLDPRWTFTGTWVNAGLGNSMAYSSGANGETATFISDVPGTRVTLLYGDKNVWGPFTVAIDGAAPVTVTPSDAGGRVGTYQVTGLANTIHKVVVTTTSTTYISLIGVIVDTGTGLRIDNAGIGSDRLSHWNNVNWYGQGVMQSGLTPAPDLAIIQMQINDAGDQLAVATYESGLTTLVQRFTALGSDVILSTGPTPTTATYGPFTISTAQWATYTAKQFSVANTLNLPLLHISERMGLYTEANASSLMGDGLHPNGSGYAVMARAFLDLLVPQALLTPTTPTYYEVGDLGTSFANGWVNYGSTFRNFKFYKDNAGVVHLEGLVKNGTGGTLTNTAVFTLPTGYRPSGDLQPLISAAGAAGQAKITSAGVVTVITGVGAGSFAGFDTQFLPV